MTIHIIDFINKRHMKLNETDMIALIDADSVARMLENYDKWLESMKVLRSMKNLLMFIYTQLPYDSQLSIVCSFSIYNTAKAYLNIKVPNKETYAISLTKEGKWNLYNGKLQKTYFEDATKEQVKHFFAKEIDIGDKFLRNL